MTTSRSSPDLSVSQPPSLDGSTHSALRVSVVSLAWTVVAGVVACTAGIVANSLVLIAFGAVGFLDAAGSAALVVHFRHSLRHEAISESHERVALRVVTTGMFVVGLATGVESVHRLISHEQSHTITTGIVLAGLSIVVLAVLSVMKRRLAPRVGSPALGADGWTSAMGALFALITLAGTVLSAAFGWSWVDPSAATFVAVGAVGLSVKLGRASGAGEVATTVVD